MDYTNTFQTNNLTIAPNGSQKIGGVAASNALSTEGQSVTLVMLMIQRVGKTFKIRHLMP